MTNNRLKILLLVLAAQGLASTFVAAETSVKHCFVFYDRASAQEEELKKYTKELENDERAIIDAEQKARTMLETKMNKFQESMAKLSDKERQKQQTDLGNEITNLQQKFTQQRNDLNQKKERILADIDSKNKLLVTSIGQSEKCSIIHNGATIVYLSDDMKKNDITDKLVERYNKAYPAKAEPAKKSAPAKSAPKK